MIVVTYRYEIYRAVILRWYDYYRCQFPYCFLWGESNLTGNKALANKSTETVERGIFIWCMLWDKSFSIVGCVMVM
jgi:hypothetical protein